MRPDPADGLTGRRAAWLSRGLLVGGTWLAFGCSGTAATYTSDADSGSTHALVTVERRTVVGSTEPDQNRAFATFVRTPPEVDPAIVTRSVGLAIGLPEPGECSSPTAPGETSGALGPLRRVELLDAGDVVLETAEGRVQLAPRAFPAATNLLAGVVYATRERSASLPDGTSYALSASGGAMRAPLSVSAEAPETLAHVLLDGVPLGAESVLDPGGGVVSWSPGSARDLVYVSLGAEGGHRVTCLFRDDAGRGAIPAHAVPSAATVSFSLHRLRVVPIAFRAMETGIDAGELRFDFEQTASIAVRAR